MKSGVVVCHAWPDTICYLYACAVAGNPGVNYSRCSVPQEMDDAAIDAELEVADLVATDSASGDLIPLARCAPHW